jgi:hypothetical protein
MIMTSTKKVPLGAFVGPGGRDIGAGYKTELFRGYLQWAGWTLGNAESIWSETGCFKDGAIADDIESDASSWTSSYTWTPSGYRGGSDGSRGGASNKTPSMMPAPSSPPQTITTQSSQFGVV